MPFVSTTRLRIRALRFMPLFAVYAVRSLNQIKSAPGFSLGSLLADRRRTFWTLTLWDSEANMRQFMTNGAHLGAMRHLPDWCDEASVVHWEGAESVLPGWAEADARMRQSGRPSRVKCPSVNHASLNYAAPRIGAAVPIRR